MNARKKILFVLQLPPPVHGASLTGQNIKNSGIINEQIDGTYIRISTRSLSGKSGIIFQLGNLLLLYTKVIKALISTRFDLVYITPCSSGLLPFYKDFGICLLSKMMCRRVIYHYHDKGLSTNPYVPTSLLKMHLKNAHVILSSKKLLYDLKGFVPKERVSYCAYGERDADISTDFGPRSLEQPTILFLAHMLRSKGVFDLLQACSILADAGEKFVCNFVGTWYDIRPEEFESFVAQHKLENFAKFLGPQYGSDKNKVLSQSDIFCLPTFYPMECFPLIILDAMRWRLPVVTTAEGAISEIVDDGETGFIVPRNQPQEIADRIKKLMNDAGLRKRMGTAGRQKYEEKYTMEKFEITLRNILLKELAN